MIDDVIYELPWVFTLRLIQSLKNRLLIPAGPFVLPVWYPSGTVWKEFGYFKFQIILHRSFGVVSVNRCCQRITAVATKRMVQIQIWENLQTQNPSGCPTGQTGENRPVGAWPDGFLNSAIIGMLLRGAIRTISWMCQFCVIWPLLSM